MGYAMEEAITNKLTEYCPLVSNEGNNDRFSCEQINEDTYLVWDASTQLMVEVLYEIEYRTFPLLLKGRLLFGSTKFRIFVLQKLNPRVL